MVGSTGAGEICRVGAEDDGGLRLFSRDFGAGADNNARSRFATSARFPRPEVDGLSFSRCNG
ncbi:MAG: hypothetical protein ACREYE_26100 [Gammaproteobacteria bacterium]